MKRPLPKHLWLPVAVTLGAGAWAIIRVSPGHLFTNLGAELGEGWPYRSSAVGYPRNSPVGPLIAQASGVDTAGLFVLLNFLVALIGVALAAGWVASQLPDAPRRWRGARLVILAPALAIMLTFLGNYDPFTVLGLALVLWAWSSRKPWAMLISGLFIGFQHFEQGLFALALIGVVALATSQERLPSPRLLGWTLSGVLAGKVGLTLTLGLLGVDPFNDRNDALGIHFRDSVVGTINFAPAFLTSLFAGLWAVVVVVALRLPGIRSRLLLATAFAIAVLAATIVLDHTRVFAIISFPALCVLIVAFLAQEPDQTATLPRLVETMAWLVIPFQVFSSGSDTRVLDLAWADRLIILFLQTRDFFGS